MGKRAKRSGHQPCHFCNTSPRGTSVVGGTDTSVEAGGKFPPVLLCSITDMYSDTQTLRVLPEGFAHVCTWMDSDHQKAWFGLLR